MDAINLADLTAHLENFMVMLLLRPLISKEVVDCEPKNLDGAAMLIKDEIPAERRAAALEVLRMKVPKHALRCYKQGPAGGWARV